MPWTMTREGIPRQGGALPAARRPTGWCDKVYSDAGGDPAACSGPISRPIRICWPGSASKPCRAKASVRPRWAAAWATTPGAGRACLPRDGLRHRAGGDRTVPRPLSRQPCRLSVADLFDPPHDWVRGFDLVYECNTIQILPGVYRLRALAAIAGMVAPGGVALVSCRSRLAGEKEGEFPLPLDRAEIDGFVRAGLRQAAFVAYDDDQDPPVRTFRCLPPGASGSGPGLTAWVADAGILLQGGLQTACCWASAPAPTRQTVPPPVRAPAGHWHACADRRNAG